ncbi:MBL fold metallo-hydrolase [Moraxella caviae]|uniref:MBL fold metallo-hydrolase n=1 Tax=Moraxella caviae TaxID=34060 RepID=A0A1T0ABU1_9GAMM|nr:MBL fold metallo-hydrolase [Moraxella caviae]OOR93186.1 MBL fold metallo-hydrolase [Moraxella caviae]STZ10457.1 N-acyl homoserine lactonase [Moraxella caviae]VEW10686.1 N-acyl homoserine lactonase [Moraxella caviae]
MKKLLLTALLGMALTTSVHAHSHPTPTYTPTKNAVPMQKTQVPGYYRVMVGDIEVTALYDGWGSMKKAMFANYSKFSESELEAILNHEFSPRTPNGGIEGAIIAFLINTGDNLILIDAGKGETQIPEFIEKGLLVTSLEAAGYKPEQIDIILPTHMHADHFGGVSKNGKMVFPNATIYLPIQEKAFWLDTPMAKVPDAAKPFVQWAREAAKPYQNKGRIKFYNAGDEVFPNVKSIPLFGHTLGHSGFEFDSKGEQLLVWGDLMHNHAIQMSHPEVAVEFDLNADSARQTRLTMLPKIAERKLLVAGAHLPFPGIGHIRAEKDGGYRWIPVEYRLIEK